MLRAVRNNIGEQEFRVNNILQKNCRHYAIVRTVNKETAAARLSEFICTITASRMFTLVYRINPAQCCRLWVRYRSLPSSGGWTRCGYCRDPAGEAHWH